MSISQSAVIVEMSISVWTANKVDKSATNKVASDNNASSDAGIYRKNLMAGTTLRKEIADYAALCRTWHNGRTMPWADKGGRLLPMSMFMDYKAEANARRDYFMDKRETFIREYPNLMLAAQRSLGSMADPLEYPSVDEVASKFDFRLVFSPVPEAGDFRISVAESDMAELRSQYESAYDSRVKEAMQSAWDRLHEMLTGMSTKLDDSTGDKRCFRDTWVPNILDLCQLLSHLNITKDPELEKARRALEVMANSVSIDAIRADEITRADLKAKVDSVLGQFEW